MTSQEFLELTSALDWYVKNDYTGFAQLTRDILNLADREGKLPLEARIDDPEPEDDRDRDEDEMDGDR